MTAPLEVECTLSNGYRTTIPKLVRRALKLGARDKLRYTIRADGTVLITRAPSGEVDDPMLSQLLGFMAADIANNPDRMQPVNSALLARIESLVGQAEVDLDAPLSAADE